MKIVIHKEQMEQRKLGYLAVAVNSSSVSLPTPTPLWRAIPWCHHTSLGTKATAPIPCLVGHLGSAGRQGGKQRPCPMENISLRCVPCSPSIPKTLSASSPWAPGSGRPGVSCSPALLAAQPNAPVHGMQKFPGRFAAPGFCGCPLTSPGQTQATPNSAPSLGKYSCWEAATQHNFQLKGNKRGRTDPLGHAGDLLWCL